MLHPEAVQQSTHELGPDVIDVEPLPDHRIRLLFEGGDIRIFDMTPFLDRGVFRKLQDPAVFDAVYVDGGTAAWPGGVDVCPETLYMDSEPE